MFSDGNPNSKVMIIGEGPGANEDKEGIPFVGRAGQLLDKMLYAINLNRKKVYITNVVNYRPPENRKPTEKRLKDICLIFKKHIEIVRPKIVLLLGSTAMNALINNTSVISKTRGKWHEIEINNLKIFTLVSFSPCLSIKTTRPKKIFVDRLKNDQRKIEKDR